MRARAPYQKLAPRNNAAAPCKGRTSAAQRWASGRALTEKEGGAPGGPVPALRAAAAAAGAADATAEEHFDSVSSSAVSPERSVKDG
eukprot:6207718-Pleurochrysis_carterae.AAC.1